MKMHGRRQERNKDEVRKLAQKDGNKFCFDCGMRGPLYVVTDFYIFVCSTCAALHRSLQHRVKGVSMTEFTDEEVAGLRVGGNDRASKVWLRSFSSARPKQGDELSVRNFIVCVFDKRAYVDPEGFNVFQEDVLRALQPEAAPQLSDSAPLSSLRPPAIPQPQPPQTITKKTITDEEAFEDFFSAPAPVPHVAPRGMNAFGTAPTATETAADLFGVAQVKETGMGGPVPGASSDFFSVQQSSVPAPPPPPPPQQQQQQQQQHYFMQDYMRQPQQQQPRPNPQQFTMQGIDMQGRGPPSRGGYGYAPPVPSQQQRSTAPAGLQGVTGSAPPGNGTQPATHGEYQNLGNMNFFEELSRDPWTLPEGIGITTTNQNPKGVSLPQKGGIHDNAFASLDPFGAPQ